MRIASLFCIGLAHFALTAFYPQPEGYISDFAQVMSASLTQELAYNLQLLAQKTGVEIAVVTITAMSDYPGTARNFEQFSHELFNNWGIGQSSRGNGILIVLSVQDRKVHIELGNGYPGYYEKITENILANDMVPYCKNGDYASAVAVGAQSVIDLIGKKVSWREFYRWHIYAGATVVTIGGLYLFYRSFMSVPAILITLPAEKQVLPPHNYPCSDSCSPKPVIIHHHSAPSTRIICHYCYREACDCKIHDKLVVLLRQQAKEQRKLAKMRAELEAEKDRQRREATVYNHTTYNVPRPIKPHVAHQVFNHGGQSSGRGSSASW